MSFYHLNDYIIKANIRYAVFDLNSTVKNQVIDENNTNLYTSLGANDYLPVECTIDYIDTRGLDLITHIGNLKYVENYKFKNGKMSANIKAKGKTKIELPLIYYLGYNITLNGQKLDYEKN